MSDRLDVLDPLYGQTSIHGPLARLVQAPIVQRLRDVRLSNVDSTSMPGIANVSRFEHSLGTMFLASQVGFFASLSDDDRIVLQAAALLHDSAISPYGHLVEEAMHYLSIEIDHEQKWSLLADGDDSDELGGMDTQIYMGRQSGLHNWAVRTFGAASREKVAEIVSAIAGKGRFGGCIASPMDLDNLDNVTRAAFHMGIEPERKLPVLIAHSMAAIDKDGVAFKPIAGEHITEWLRLRRDVYTRFMLAKPDFAGKVMLLYATTAALQSGKLSRDDWKMTDREFIERLCHSAEPGVADTVRRWLCGELWPISELCWMEGGAPSYPQVWRFCQHISEVLTWECFAYRIRDKISLKLNIPILGHQPETLGDATNRWLLGVGSSKKKPFSRQENTRILREAEGFFGTPAIGIASEQEVGQGDMFL